MMRPKSPRQENQHLRDMARKHACQMLWAPGCLGDDDSTTVMAHENSLAAGKGMGLKAHDHIAVYACFACHAALDQGRQPAAQKREAFSRAMVRQVRLYREIAASPSAKPRDRAAALWALDRIDAASRSVIGLDGGVDQGANPG
ncbi:MAG: nuclease domain-containing protein [Burkholderiales bacterium]